MPASGEKERKIWHVGDLRVDSDARTVTRDGCSLPVPRLSFDLLEALIEAAPGVLSTDDLMDRVWAGKVVSPATVAKRIALLRDALGDDSDEPRYVTLVRGYGYGLAVEPVREEPSAAPASQSASRRPAIRWIGAVLAALVVIAGLAAWFMRPDSTGTEPIEKSIAVLPFQAIGDDVADQQFADGLTEEIIHSLSRTGSLLVAGRSSSFRFVDSDEDPATIGETLGVAHLLEGSVRRSGDQVRIVAQLIDSRDGLQRWSESWVRTMGDVIAVQREISERVSEQLQATLAKSDRSDMPITENAEAYALYLRAKSLMEYPYGSDLPRAQELLEQAVALDPQFAAAWAHLGAVHGRRTLWNDASYDLSAEDSLRVARDAFDRALAADPEEGSTYALLAGIVWVFEDDISKTAQLASQAIRLRPWDLELLMFAADISRSLGRLEQARQLTSYVLARDPLCGWCRVSLLTTLLALEDYESLAREARLAMQVTPRPRNSEYLVFFLGRAHLLGGDPAEAAAEFRQLGEASDIRLAGLAMTSHTLGDELESERYQETLLAQSRGHASLHAQVAAWRGEHEQALGFLNEWVERPDLRITLQTNYRNPVFNSLHGLPGWKRFLERIGRSPEQIDGIEFDVMPYIDAIENAVPAGRRIANREHDRRSVQSQVPGLPISDSPAASTMRSASSGSR